MWPHATILIAFWVWCTLTFSLPCVLWGNFRSHHVRIILTRFKKTCNFVCVQPRAHCRLFYAFICFLWMVCKDNPTYAWADNAYYWGNSEGNTEPKSSGQWIDHFIQMQIITVCTLFGHPLCLCSVAISVRNSLLTFPDFVRYLNTGLWSKLFVHGLLVWYTQNVMEVMKDQRPNANWNENFFLNQVYTNR